MVLKLFFDLSTSFWFSENQCECTLHSWSTSLALFPPGEGRLSPRITNGIPNLFHLPASLFWLSRESLFTNTLVLTYIYFLQSGCDFCWIQLYRFLSSFCCPLTRLKHCKLSIFNTVTVYFQAICVWTMWSFFKFDKNSVKFQNIELVTL